MSTQLQKLMEARKLAAAQAAQGNAPEAIETEKRIGATISRLEEIRKRIAESRAAREGTEPLQSVPPQGDPFSKLETQAPVKKITAKVVESIQTHGGWNKYGDWVDYNAAQQEAVVKAVVERKSCCVIGSAGTGKTTVMNGIASGLVNSGAIPLEADFGDHKYLQSGTPGIVFCSYTHVATNNLRANLPDSLKGNCLTIHKLIEFQPVWYEVEAADGTILKKMKFEETRTEMRPLPSDIKVVVFEESSMIDVELYNKVRRALPHHVQFIMLGDIQQLTPVFGSAVLGFKMMEYPLIYLTEIYRQASDSAIIKLAYRILEGKPIPLKELETFNGNGLGIFPAKHAIADPAIAEEHLGRFYCQAIDAGVYDPETDMILCPFNKQPGTIGINKHVANHLAKKRNAIVFEVFAGFEEKYFAVGDKIFADRKEGKITAIKRNGLYFGKMVQEESVYLDYWGINHTPEGKAAAKLELDSLTQIENMSEEELFRLMDAAIEDDSPERRKRQASHVIDVVFNDGTEALYSSAGEVNAITHAYALSVHKAQGSEWRTVFLALHRKHNVMLCRELLYTAVTRARERLHILCERDTFIKGVVTQEIPGNTIKEKIKHFAEKTQRGDVVPLAG